MVAALGVVFVIFSLCLHGLYLRYYVRKGYGRFEMDNDLFISLWAWHVNERQLEQAAQFCSSMRLKAAFLPSVCLELLQLGNSEIMPAVLERSEARCQELGAQEPFSRFYFLCLLFEMAGCAACIHFTAANLLVVSTIIVSMLVQLAFFALVLKLGFSAQRAISSTPYYVEQSIRRIQILDLAPLPK